jgi:hypothetical protein
MTDILPPCFGQQSTSMEEGLSEFCFDIVWDSIFHIPVSKGIIVDDRILLFQRYYALKMRIDCFLFYFRN